MKKFLIPLIPLLIVLFWSCNPSNSSHTESGTQDTFQYQTEQFADLRILRYKVPGFEQLTLKQKELAYYLTQAALSGREIFYDQNCKINLTVKRTFEAILEDYNGDKKSEDWKKFVEFAKRVWFSNGIHHHYSMQKFVPEFSQKYLAHLIKNSPDAKFPLERGESVDYFINRLNLLLFEPTIYSKRVNLEANVDLIKTSAMNYYEEITQKEVEDFYEKLTDKNDKTPVMWGLNSKLMKENGEITEQFYKVGGLYTTAIEKIIYWLKKAEEVAESELQRQSIEKLVEFYQTGDLKKFDEYNMLWVKDTVPTIDFTNGFIETYGDPLNHRGAWQSVVYIKDFETTQKFKMLSEDVAWFEKNLPIMEEYKRPEPKGVSYKVVNVVVEAGDCSPATPIGVNLPNSNWIREMHGSKSVSLGNIESAYDESSKSTGMLEEFNTPEQVELIQKYGALASKLHVGLHEVIGHGSGKMKDGLSSAKEALKNYTSTIEEARADLVGLYFVLDQHLVDKGLIPSLEVGKAQYNSYITNGLMRQLTRLSLGSNVEESHMRNRQLIAKWCYEKGKTDKVIELKKISGKTFVIINDYQKLRTLFGQLLREIQRIKSEGDFKAGSELVEGFAVKVDHELHKEVLERYKKINVAPYAGFINPQLVPVMQGEVLTDVKITYPNDFMQQMLFYAKEYRILPTNN